MEFSHGFTARPKDVSSPKKSSNFMVSNPEVTRVCEARDLVKSLIEDKRCFSTESGSETFAEVCAADCVFEDCYEPEPFVGKEVCALGGRTCVSRRQGLSDFLHEIFLKFFIQFFPTFDMFYVGRYQSRPF